MTDPELKELIREGMRLRKRAPARNFDLDRVKVDPEDGYVFVPECTQLGETCLQVTMDGYEGYGDDALYVAWAAKNAPALMRALKAYLT